MLSHGLWMTLTLAAMLTGDQPTLENYGALRTVSELLKHHNIQLEQPAVVEALKNADPEVRWLAGEKLAEDKAAETIPAILDALATEKVQWTRMNIAYALAQLGESTGLITLEGNCENHDLDAGTRAQSADYVFRLNGKSTVCLDALLDILQTGSNGYRAQAASLLSQLHGLTSADAERVFVGLVEALHASAAFVQIAAGRGLADIGEKRALAELKMAVESEEDENIRVPMQQSLKILQEKLRQ